ncbi:MAG: hypothetical protein R2941_07565 [Desulfobacterales bacterium]
MVLNTKLCADGMYRDDTLMVLNELSKTKMEFDIIMCHTFPTISATSHILSSAQRYAYENTIPCTEWPVTGDTVNIVLQEAIKHSKAKEWKLSETDENNAYIGSYCAGEVDGKWVRIA